MTNTMTISSAAWPFIYAAEADPNMTCRQAAVLALVAAYPGKSNNTIAGLLGASCPIVTRAVDKLIELGLMTRRVSIMDRRKVELTVTPAGARLVREIASA